MHAALAFRRCSVQKTPQTLSHAYPHPALQSFCPHMYLAAAGVLVGIAEQGKDQIGLIAAPYRDQHQMNKEELGKQAHVE